jgi:hypothetical protein
VIKLSAAILALLVAGTLAGYRTEQVSRRRALLAVGIPAEALAAFTVGSPLDIGVRGGRGADRPSPARHFP